jgi:hypothetical protein
MMVMMVTLLIWLMMVNNVIFSHCKKHQETTIRGLQIQPCTACEPNTARASSGTGACRRPVHVEKPGN